MRIRQQYQGCRRYVPEEFEDEGEDEGEDEETLVIHTEALTRRFAGLGKGPEITAVESLDLDVRPGEVFGFLGPNGAGKTTTVRMLAALIAPSSGRAWVNGHDVLHDEMAVRRSVGVLTETPGLYEKMTAEHNLAFYARLYG